MRRTIAVLVTACTLAVAVQAASASTFTIVEPTFRATYRAFTFQSGEIRVVCALTISGTFVAQTIAKTSGSNIGSVTRASVAECTGGTVRILAEALPWRIQYSSFAGTLPEITSVTMRLIGAAFQIHPTGQPECLARTETRSPLVVIAERDTIGDVTALKAEEAGTIPLTGEFLCSLVRGRVAGSASVTIESESAGIVILLGEEGEELTVSGSEARERLQQPLNQLTIPAASTEGTLAIENRETWRDVTISGVGLIGANSEKFELLREEEAACKPRFVLLSSRNNACNIRVRVKAGNARPFNSTVSIIYTWGIIFTSTSSMRFTVRAEST